MPRTLPLPLERSRRCRQRLLRQKADQGRVVSERLDLLVERQQRTELAEAFFGVNDAVPDLVEALGDEAGVAMALVNLGDVARERGHTVRAAELHEEALAMHRELGNRRGADRAYGRLSAIR